MSNTPDLSKIVNLIMQNPSLIAEISALANQTEKTDTSDRESVEENPPPEAQAVDAPVSATVSARSHRHELLSALKPYLSENRRSAVDSMMSISDILDMVRKR